MEIDLPLIWAGVIGLAVALYVILDGFDLGVGILFPFAKTDKERDQMVHSIAPFWDGNETWLVLGGGGLWVAFPRAYAVIMSALYLPVIVMLLALVFRGVAFEFRAIARSSKPYWNAAFYGGSTLAALSQGMVLGGLIQGINVKDGAFAGGPFDWATPFALLCGLGVLAGYALPTLTIWDTAAAAASQRFMLIGTLILLPIILGYFVFVFWVFRGKSREGDSYHH
jgi:cytochrome d ubiquinol oxidase subunit II